MSTDYPEKIYKGVIRLSKPLLRWHLDRRIPRGKEVALRLGERYGFASKPRPAGKLIWMHAASNGESLSLLPMIERLRALSSPPSIMVTTGTVGSATLMEKRLPEGCFHQFVPLDHPDWVIRFLNYWKPDGVVWVESDLWPSLLSHVRARKIPAALLNAKLSIKSGGRWMWFPQWAKSIADTFMVITAQTPDDAMRWEKMGGAKPQLLGNLKFIASPLPCDTQALALLQESVGNRPLWVMASAHPGEELVARDVHLHLQKTYPDLLTIIVPRHTQNGVKFAETLQQAGLTTALRSQQQPVTPQMQVYIADTMGELGMFYRLSKLSVVGGSFAPIGGHNPIEPALLGGFPLYGPHMSAQTSICAAFENAGAAQPVADAAELASVLKKLLADPAELQRLCNKAQAVCTKEAKSGPLIWDALTPWREEIGLL